MQGSTKSGQNKAYRGRLLGRTLWSAAAIVGIGLAASSTHAADAPAKFRAGAATSNISPWIGLSLNGGMQDRATTHVHDELHARALVLDDGRSKLAIVVCDSCMIPREIVTAAKKLINDRMKLSPDRVLISATHAHSCPTGGSVFQSDPDANYTRFLAIRIADAVEQATNNLAPAKIGWGAGKNDQQVFNRRWYLKPGTVPPDPFGRNNDRVKMNPGVANANLVEPAGPIDPEVPIVAVQTPEGRPLALLANYSLHYVGGVTGSHASADYFGAFADRVQELLKADRQDPPFVAMMSNGTSGDINNINFRVPAKPSKPYEKLHEVADELAQETVRVARSIEYHDDVTLDARAVDLKLGVRLPSAEDIERAESIVAAAKAKGTPLRTLDEVYARETLFLRDFPKQVDANIQALRIGPLGIVAIPCEVFVEIGLKLKAESPLKPTFTIELANGYNGYLPTKPQHALGGYETWRARSSYLEVDAADKITAKALELLTALKAANSAQ